MNAIPWYRSPVLISAITSILSQLAVLFGVADEIAPEAIEKAVNGGLEVVSVAALVWTVIARVRSQVQPVTLTKAAAAAKGTSNA